jgi:hypothetical protein
MSPTSTVAQSDLPQRGGQELREVTHRGQARVDRGMAAWLGAGAAGTVAAGD